MSARRPALALIREGNPGHHPKARLEGGVRLRPEAPAEPDWEQWFPRIAGHPERAAEMTRCRRVAREEWRRVVRQLDAQGLLALVDFAVLADFCRVWARLDQCERDLSRNGIWVPGERGAQKNPSSTLANQLRTQLKTYLVHLGLTPLARDALKPQEADDGEGSPFD